jgi:hypothetical protein
MGPRIFAADTPQPRGEGHRPLQDCGRSLEGAPSTPIRCDPRIVVMSKAPSTVPRAAIERALWDGLAEQSPYGWIHHLNDWIDTYKTWHDMDERSFGILDREGMLAALVPCYLVRQRLRPLRLASIQVHGGVCFRNGLSSKAEQEIALEARKALERAAMRVRARSITATIPPLAPICMEATHPTPNPLWNLAFDDQSGATWMIDLRTSQEALWNSLEGRARTAVRKAQNAKVQVINCAGRPWCEAYYDLHVATAVRTGIRPHPFAFFEAISSRLVPARLATPYLAEINGRVIAGSIILMWKNGAFYNSGAAKDEGLKSEANSLLLWTAIKRAAEADAHYFEVGEAAPLVGSGKLLGLSTYKKSFGGQQFPLWRGRCDGPNRWLTRASYLARALRG